MSTGRAATRSKAARAGAAAGVRGAETPDLVEMRVVEVFADPLRGLPVVALEDAAGARLSLDVGLLEAPAIASELAGVALERPATHDLLKAIVESCGARVEAVELRAVRAGVVHATVVLRVAGRDTVDVDARPSDALALGLRTRATVRVSRKVIAWAARRDERRRREAETLAGALLLDALPDEDFGKWKM